MLRCEGLEKISFLIPILSVDLVITNGVVAAYGKPSTMTTATILLKQRGDQDEINRVASSATTENIGEGLAG